VSGPEYRTYDFAGLGEQALCFGMGNTRRILILPPFFDEMNRVRRMLVQAMRMLEAQGCGAILPDLPGCNESMAKLEAQDLSSWRAAVAAAAEQLGATHVAAIRGGALLDDALPDLPHWRLAPVKGQSLLKAMIRTRIAGAKEEGIALTEAGLMAEAMAGPLSFAGNVLSPSMVTQLGEAVPAELDNVVERRLGDDLEGSTLWLRAEPQDDAAMSASLAQDWAQWSQSCGG
jgi:hypothetical protein